MSILPDVYYITIQNGWGVIKHAENSYSLSPHGEATMFLEDDIEKEAEKVETHFNTETSVKLADKDIVRTIGKNFMHGLQKLGESDELYPPKVINKLVDCLKDEKKNLQRLSDALKPVSSTDIKNEEEIKMAEEKTTKREEVAVRFYEGMVSKKLVNLKKGDATIKLKRVKLPNDDPKDSTARRSFLVAENKIFTDKKNPHMLFTYLGKDQEYKVQRNDFNPETKENKVLEETKMTGQAIADVFKAEADKSYAAWKESQPVATNEIDTPFEETIENDKGIEA